MGNDDLKITIGDTTYDTSTLDTITIDTSWTNDTGSDYTINTNTDYSTTIAGVLNDDVTYTIGGFNEDYLDTAQIKNMSEEYPALKTAYEKFKTIYDMTLQDWKGKQDD